jgi:putative PIN family toxin of toxin-antitoxin system
VRVVLDPNVIISALLNRDGTPAVLLRAWTAGGFELLVSPLLLAELARALGYSKLQSRIPREDAEAIVGWLRRAATLVDDPPDAPPIRSRDPGDDYLLALAAASDAVLVSGDRHLLDLAADAPIVSPAEFLAEISESGSAPT